MVAERDGRLIGTAFARVHAVSSMSDELAAELANLVVAPDMRRQGVGRALVAEVARWARRKGAHRVVVKTYSKNAPARLFWEDLGFAPRLVQMTAPVEDLARGEA